MYLVLVNDLFDITDFRQIEDLLAYWTSLPVCDVLFVPGRQIVCLSPGGQMICPTGTNKTSQTGKLVQ